MSIKEKISSTQSATHNHQFQAKWIEPIQEKTIPEPLFTMMDMFHGTADLVQEPIEKRLNPCLYLKKIFTIPQVTDVKKATLYATAHGIYQTTLNGQSVTDALFAPDYTSYQRYLQYQEYDITDRLQTENVWGVVLADGWFAGRVSMTGGSAQFGDTLAFLGEIELEYTDGHKEWIITDEDFVSTTGRYVYSDIFIGEKQDFRNEHPNWQQTTDIFHWKPVNLAAIGFDQLRPQSAPQVKRKAVLPPIKIWSQEESVIVDFGQVIAGRIRVDAQLAIGEEVQMAHSEILDSEGKFIENIVGRNKEQRDSFIGDGQPHRLEPDFTFHGFRYIQLTGAVHQLALDTLEAVVIYSDLAKTGQLITSDAKLNQLLHNIEWSQKGNMLSIPTDCPQRERLGWTGDIQVYADTATFFMDVEAFLQRWLESVMADQQPNGEIVDYSPVPKDYFTTRPKDRGNSSAGWGDAIIMVPWTLYQKYGNQEILHRCYDAMVNWHQFAKTSAAGEKTGVEQFIWNTKFHYGDWMFPSVMSQKGPFLTAKLTKDIVGTAFLAHSSQLLGTIAELLGKAEAPTFFAYAEKVKQAYQEVFWKENHLTPDLQGSYVLALAFDLLAEDQVEPAVKRLVTLIKENDYRLDTGFVTVPYILEVLQMHGEEKIAEKLLFQEACPSWLYEVNHGATTMWESWDAVKPDGTIGKESFNHYATGCVGDWLVRHVGGLTAKLPGYQEFYVNPAQFERITSAELYYDTRFGRITIEWYDHPAERQLTFTVPNDTTAYVATKNLQAVNRQTLSGNQAVSIWDRENRYQSLEPGTYQLTYKR